LQLEGTELCRILGREGDELARERLLALRLGTRQAQAREEVGLDLRARGAELLLVEQSIARAIELGPDLDQRQRLEAQLDVRARALDADLGATLGGRVCPGRGQEQGEAREHHARGRSVAGRAVLAAAR